MNERSLYSLQKQLRFNIGKYECDVEQRVVHTEIFECGLIIAVSHFHTEEVELVLIRKV